MNTETQAPANSHTPPQNPIMGFLPIVAIFAIFYFFVIRPQSKKAKADAKMRDEVKVGDKIVLTSGIFATVKEIHADKDLISVEISNNVNVLVYKSSIAKTLEKDENAKISK